MFKILFKHREKKHYLAIFLEKSRERRYFKLVTCLI